MTQRSPKFLLQVALCFFCIYVPWGSTYFAIHYAVLDLSPPIVSGLRYFLSAPFLFLLCMLKGISLRITLREFLQCSALGALLLVGNNCLLVWAEQTIATGFAAMVLAATPLFIALLDRIIPGGQRLTRIGWFGLLLGFVGLITLLWPTVRHLSFQGKDKVFGCMLLVIAGLCWAMGSVLSKRFKMQRDPFLISGWQLLLGGSFNLLIATALGAWSTARWTRPALIGVAYLWIVGSVIGFTAYTWLLHHVAVAKVGTYAYVNPIVAVFLGVWLLHEKLNGYEMTGMFIILAAVAMVTLSKVRTTQAAKA